MNIVLMSIALAASHFKHFMISNIVPSPIQFYLLFQNAPS